MPSAARAYRRSPGLHRIPRVGLQNCELHEPDRRRPDEPPAAGGDAQGRLRRADAVPRPAHAVLGLWALRQLNREPLEVSYSPGGRAGPVAERTEAVAIAVHRQDHGRSPTLNFGRIPAGYRMSSGNNARLVAARRRPARDQASVSRMQMQELPI
jgi:hypothetical protein